MDEQQILEQLNSLSEEVKPRDKWVNVTKNELFDQEQQEAAATLISKAFAPLRKPVMALAALGLIALTLGSAMVYSPQLVKIDEPMPRIGNDNAQIAASVEKLNANLKRINERLATVEDSNDINEVIPKLATIEVTAQQGAEVASDTETYASLAEDFENAAETAHAKSSELVGTVIDEFEGRTEYLSEEEKTQLEKARQAYREEDFPRALLLLKPFLQ